MAAISPHLNWYLDSKSVEGRNALHAGESNDLKSGHIRRWSTDSDVDMQHSVVRILSRLTVLCRRIGRPEGCAAAEQCMPRHALEDFAPDPGPR